MADVIALSPLQERTPANVLAEADAIAKVLAADSTSTDPATQFQVILRLQSIWLKLGNTHREALRGRTCERLALKPTRFDYLITCRENSKLRLALAYWPTADPRLQDDEQYCTRLGGWVDKYVKWCWRSKAPLAFHVWSAFTILGTAARRNFYMPVGVNGFNYPNLYTLLVGDSGSGKSFAIDAARDVLNTMNDRLLLDGGHDPDYSILKTVHIVGDSVTKAALEEILAKPARQRCAPITIDDSPGQWETVACLIADEAVSLLGRDMFSVEELIVALTQMYGGKYEGNTLARGKVIIPNLSLSLLLGSAMSWLQHTMKETVFQGGFMGARCLAIERNETIRKHDYPDEPILDPVECEDLAIYLTELAKSKPRPMRRTKAAQTFYEEWYRTPYPEPPDDRARAYFARRFRPINKLSMGFSLSRSPNGIIELEDVEQAIAVMKAEEPVMLRCFTAMVQNSRAGSDVDWLTRILMRAGGSMSRSELTRTLSRRMRSREYKDLLSAMLEGGELATRKGRKPLGGGIIPEVIYLTEFQDSEGNQIKKVPKLK